MSSFIWIASWLGKGVGGSGCRVAVGTGRLGATTSDRVNDNPYERGDGARLVHDLVYYWSYMETPSPSFPLGSAVKTKNNSSRAPHSLAWSGTGN